MTSRAASFWLNSQELCFQSGQELPPLADAVVIGGGITGISTAYWLSHLGLRPVVLERGDLSCGATGRNGGHFVFQSRTARPQPNARSHPQLPFPLPF